MTPQQRTGNVKPCNNNLIFTQEKLRVGECILKMHQLQSLLIGIQDLKSFAQGEWPGTRAWQYGPTLHPSSTTSAPESYKNILQFYKSLDGEFTGLNAYRGISPFDTPEERYDKVKDSARQFLLIQFGLSTIQNHLDHPARDWLSEQDILSSVKLKLIFQKIGIADVVHVISSTFV